MEVKQIYTKKLITVRDVAPLMDADDLMNNYNIRHLPVVDSDGYLVGILSKSDFIALKYVDSRLTNYIVKDFMSAPVKAVKKSSSINEVAKMFVTKKISCALVVDHEEAVGIVTTEDLVRLLADNTDFMNEAEQLDLASLADEGWISGTLSQ